MVEGSLIHSFKSNAMEIQARGYEKIEEFLTKTGKDRTFWEAYYAHVVCFFGGYLTRYYFNPNNPKSKSEVKKEINDTLSKNPWFEAARNVNWSKLRSKDKLLALSERYKSYLGLKFYVFLKHLFGKETM